MIVDTCALPVDSILRRYSDGAYTVTGNYAAFYRGGWR